MVYIEIDDLPGTVTHLPELDKKLICIGIEKLINKDYFDITLVDNLMSIFKLRKDNSTYPLLKLMHCVHYSEMGETTATELIIKTLSFLGIINRSFTITVNPNEKTKTISFKVIKDEK